MKPKRMKQYRLFLDDIRMPIDAWLYTEYEPYRHEHWKIVRNYDQFVSFISRNYKKHGIMPSIIGFDHDLADEHYGADVEDTFKEKTGMDCAKWLVDFCIDNEVKLPDWYGHSMNPAGKENINSYLTNYRKHEKNN